MRDLEIDGFFGRQAMGSEAPAILLRDTKNAFIHNCRAPEGTGVFLKLDEGSERVSLMNNELGAARKAVERGTESVLSSCLRRGTGCRACR